MAFERRLTLLRRARELAVLVNGTAASALDAELVGMERLRERVFVPWRSSDELEELAARDYPLPQARLRELARQHPPAQS